MRKYLNIVIPIGLALSFFSCIQHHDDSIPKSFNPKIVEAKGYVVPHDSISEPRVILIDENKLTKVKVGKPKVVLVHSNIHLAGMPKVVIAGAPRVCTPGTDTFSLPKIVPAIDSPFVAGIPEMVIAKDPYSKDQNPMNFSSFSKRQGMKHAFISMMIQDKVGNLWIGTYGGGVSKFDGKMFTHFTTKEGLSSNTVLCFLQDRVGNIWIGTSDRGVNKFDGKLFTHFTDKEGFCKDPVIIIREDRDGNLWFASTDGVYKYDGKSFARFTKKEGLLDNLVNDILEDRVGNLWFASEEGVSKYDGKSFYHFTDKEGLSNKIVNCILEDQEGNLWFGTYGGGMNKYDGIFFTHFTEEQGLSNNDILSVLQDHAGNLWFGTSGGVNSYDGITFTHFTEREGLLNERITSILEDQAGNLWFGTFGGGVNKYDGKTFTHFTENEGLSNSEVNNILQDEEGNLWLGTNDGINLYDGNSFTHLTVEKELPNNVVGDIIKDRNGNLWFGTYGGGACKYESPKNGEAATITYFTEAKGLADNIILSILEDQEGNIWFGTNEGVSKYDGVSFTTFTETEGLSNNAINCMLEDQAGNMWFGTFGGGVSKYEPPINNQAASFTHFTEKEGMTSNIVRSMIEDQYGNLWFGTDGGGVTKYSPSNDDQPATFMHFTDKEGLSNNAVLSILEDRTGNLWFGTRVGVSKLTPDKVAAFSIQKRLNNINESDVIFKNYTYENGFLGFGCTVNSILEDRNGIIWIGANDRLTAYNPEAEELSLDSIPPNIQLTGVSLFNERISWTEIENDQDSTLMLGNGVKVKNFRFDHSTNWYGLPEHLSLAYNNNYLSFNYIGITMNQPAKVKYKYKLEGNDENWSPITSRSEAPYGNLPHGSYTFRVKAMNSAGYWSDEFQFPFRIRPPWWLTWWAYSLYGLMFVSLMYFGHRYQKQQTIRKEQEKSKQKQAILNERLRISRDLHDEVGATLSGIVMYSHLAKSQANDGNQEVKNSINIVQETASEMVNKLNDVVWLVNPEQDNLEKLIEKLEDYAGKATESQHIEFSINMPEKMESFSLPIEVRKNIYLFCKEAINNAVKYSKGTLIELGVNRTDSNITFTIRDNGIGFDPKSVKKGNGLNNLQTRAEEIGADYTLSTKPEMGTLLQLKYKIT